MPPRFLRGNKGTEAPSNLIFVDTESYQHAVKAVTPRTTHSLRLWCATRVRLEAGEVSRRAKAASTRQEDFWAWLDRYSDAHRTTWVFAHNLGFDATLLGFWRELDERRFTLEPMYKRDRSGRLTSERSWVGRLIIEPHVTLFKVRSAGKRFVFVDTCNYWHCALHVIGEAYGVPKLKMPEADAPQADWLMYCERDVEILERSVCDLINRWTREKCGVFKTTAAGLAFTSWRHTCDIRRADGETLDVLCNPGAPEHELERASYFGGRTQVYQIGRIDGPIYHVDANSLYPAMMEQHLFPRRYIRSEHGSDPRTVVERSAVYACVAEAFIESGQETVPVRIDGRQYHCRGSLWTVLAGPELFRAIQCGIVSRLGTVHYYSQARLFSGWVRYWYGRKLRAIQSGRNGLAERNFCNTILKSLSGKFAQHGRHWTDLPGRTAIKRWGGWPEILSGELSGMAGGSRGRFGSDNDSAKAKKRWRLLRGIAGNCQVLDDSGEPSHAFPLISSYITSYARLYMADVIALAGQENVYYMATDSLILSQQGWDRLNAAGLVHPYELGKFKLVGKHDYGEIIGANHYSLDGKVTVAGWEAKARTGMGGIRVCDVWERLPSIVQNGPRDTVTVSTLPTGATVHDIKGRRDLFGRWHPYYLCDDPLHTDRPPKGGYTDDDLTRLVSPFSE